MPDSQGYPLNLWQNKKDENSIVIYDIFFIIDQIIWFKGHSCQSDYMVKGHCFQSGMPCHRGLLENKTTILLIGLQQVFCIMYLLRVSDLNVNQLNIFKIDTNLKCF